MKKLINTPMIPTRYPLDKKKVGFDEIKKDTFFNRIAEEVNIAIGEMKYRLIHKDQRDKAEKQTAKLHRKARKSTYHGQNIYDPKAGSEEECYL